MWARPRPPSSSLRAIASASFKSFDRVSPIEAFLGSPAGGPSFYCEVKLMGTTKGQPSYIDADERLGKDKIPRQEDERNWRHPTNCWHRVAGDFCISGRRAIGFGCSRRGPGHHWHAGGRSEEHTSE